MKPLLKIALTFSVALFIGCGTFAAYLLTGQSGTESVNIADKAGWGEKNQKKNESQPEIFTEDDYKGVKIGKKVILPADFKEIEIVETCIGYHYLAGQGVTGKALFGPAGERLSQNMYARCITHEYDGHCYLYLISAVGGDGSFMILNDRYETVIERQWEFAYVKILHKNIAVLVRRNSNNILMDLQTKELLTSFPGARIELWEPQKILIATYITFYEVICLNDDGTSIIMKNGKEFLPVTYVENVVENGAERPCCIRIYRETGTKGEWDQILYNIEEGVEYYEGWVDAEEKKASVKQLQSGR